MPILVVLFLDSVTNCSPFHQRLKLVFKSMKREENTGTVAHGTFSTLFLLFCPGRSWQTRENVMLSLLHKGWDIHFFFPLFFVISTDDATQSNTRESARGPAGRLGKAHFLWVMPCSYFM